MRSIGFITKNKVLAQSLAIQIMSDPKLNFKPYLLRDPRQAVLDAEILKIDIAVIEMISGTQPDIDAVLSLCENLRRAVPACRILLFVARDDSASRRAAMKAMKRKVIDDFVFYDESLQYLLAKLGAL